MVASDTTAASTSPREPLPVRMLNEFAYCPRLFHLMHVEQRWADNQYTAEGKEVHRRVDQLDHVLPDPQKADDQDDQDAADDTNGQPAKSKTKAQRDDGQEPPEVSRSVPLASERLGLTAKLDLVSTADDEAVPVETKRGKVPSNEQRSYEPERVQLMAQGLLLREHGYQCDHGVLYFHGSRTRVDISFDEDLEARTLHLIKQAHQAGQRRQLPEPLEDSPKCNGCSVGGFACLMKRSRCNRCRPTTPYRGSADCIQPATTRCRSTYKSKGRIPSASPDNTVARWVKWPTVRSP